VIHGVPNPIFGIWPGVVVDNVDPEGLHRVRVDVEGITGDSAWALPLGAGGFHQRGGHIAPALGANVAVQFLGGDIERPVYQTLHWAKAPPLVEGDPAGMQPPALRDVPSEEAHLVQAIMVGPLELSIDERPGQRKLVVRDVEVDDCFVLWDLEQKALQVQMRSAILIQSVGSLVLDGLMVRLKRRLVLPMTKAIG
jgi:hypothetical protein